MARLDVAGVILCLLRIRTAKSGIAAAEPGKRGLMGKP
jgi:hypothetical protein